MQELATGVIVQGGDSPLCAVCGRRYDLWILNHQPIGVVVNTSTTSTHDIGERI